VVDRSSLARYLTPMALRSLVFALVWLGLTEGDLKDWWLGLAFVAIAAAASLVLMPPGGRRWRPGGVAPFVAFFLRQSLLGGLDVARRALDPRMPVDPVFIEFRTGLTDEAAIVLLADIASLLPGTVTADIAGQHLVVHVLDRNMPAPDTLRRLEERIAGLTA
jgi:multicomponent Na+:H+ antiporter subunit E